MINLTLNINQKPSLMDDIVSIRDNLAAQEDDFGSIDIVPGELSEAFAMLDPDLALLHKDMKTAAAQLSHARKTRQMVDTAKWRFDTAESAYQTRLLEVRSNKLLNNAASILLKDGEAAAKRQLHELSMQEKMNEQFAALRKKRMEEKRRNEESSGGWLFYFILGLWLAQMQAQNYRNTMEKSRLQNAFSAARTY